MSIIKANIISLFLSLSEEEKKKVIAELQQMVKGEPTGGKNISEEKL